MYPQVNSRQSFPELEEKVIKFWNENRIFDKSLEIREWAEEFSFYDGPPFATGTPHYGHILAWTMKDVVPRYQTMKWRYVPRNFWWDCHGLPIENIVEKKLWISGKLDIEEKIWVHCFNEWCRENVLTYVWEWRKIVERMWRWVDMDNDYKTMDASFMESVWWVFKTIYDKWLIYEWNRVVPYCPRCSTPLSNFEVNQWYKDKQDKTVTVKFKVKDSSNKYILAWTTTPWTLYANLWLAVWAEIDYVELQDKSNSDIYVLAEAKIGDYYKNPEDYTILRSYKWACLAWIEYEPLFDDFYTQKVDMNADLWPVNNLWKNSYKVVIGHHVTTESGTWVVHIAPAFWEDDNIIGKKEDLGFFNHIDDTGKTQYLLQFNEEFVFDFNDHVIQLLKDQKSVVKISTVDHSYPHCWRCDTPLIYRWISAWYVAVEKIRDQMIANNEKIHWVPESIKYGRFGNWLEWARDWNISRNRYWWSAMPVWQSEDKTEEVCIGSIEELYELNKDFSQIEKKWDKFYYTETGSEVDLHKHFVDKILVKNPKTGNTLKRIPEVLDCWFESGAMPYASKHYPFENNESFKFPADFIAEWLDQTRGWFYTLLVLGTALFDNTPFLNVIVNGIVLAEDGRKMSKSLKNYPDPSLIMDGYWADAMRFYMLNSPVVKADDLRFSETWVAEVVKKVILPFWNTYSFFTTYANIDNFTADSTEVYFVRHGQTDNNNKHILNGQEANEDLNQIWLEQASQTAKEIKNSQIKFDVIISSPQVRAKHTAEIINKEAWLNIEIIEEDLLKEQAFWEFSGKSHADLEKEYNLHTVPERARVYRNNSVENIEQFDLRNKKAYEQILEKYKWKKVLIVAHGGNFRSIAKYLNNLTDEEAYFEKSEKVSQSNAQFTKLSTYKRENNLDKWIIAELQELVKTVTEKLDEYDLQQATDPISGFMDKLTNWYIRRSRRRFWKSENDGDKLQAYNTLYEVLATVSKVIAPFMPFVSEEVYKWLTGNLSVHLDNWPKFESYLMFEELEYQMDKTQKVVNLWLALRADKKVRVRQPLQSITTTEKLDDYYVEIIKEELNVKEVIYLEDSSSLAKKVCRPNAKLIWPRFGKDVQFVIKEAKAGNFSELENGRIKVGEFELEAGEYEIAFEASNTELDIQSDYGMVIAMDMHVTDSLRNEWYTRDLIRVIQDSRKEAWYSVSDRIEISVSGNNIDFLNEFRDYIESETLSKITNLSSYDLEKQVELDEGMEVKLMLNK